VSHSPLESAVVFHIGPVPIAATVVTTWVLMAALAIAALLATRRLRVVPSGWQAALETLVSELQEEIRGG
jgi:F-type H+-transporting ATPase subunit a